MITIAIPCYKSDPNLLKRAISSVLRQSSPNWVLHIVDGNSVPDPMLQEIVSDLQSGKVFYFRNDKNLTMAGNWNECIESANTNLVSLLHDDDFLQPRYVEEMLELVEKFPSAAVYFCDVRICDQDGKGTSTVADNIKKLIRPKADEVILRGDSGLSAVLKGCFIFCPTIVYRKDLFPTNPFNQKWNMVTDLQLYFDCLFYGNEMVGTAKKLFNYCRHNKNQTVILTENLMRFEEELAFYDSIVPQLGKIGWRKSLFHAKYKVIIRCHLLYRALAELRSFHLRKVFQIIKLVIKGG